MKVASPRFLGAMFAWVLASGTIVEPAAAAEVFEADLGTFVQTTHIVPESMQIEGRVVRTRLRVVDRDTLDTDRALDTFFGRIGYSPAPRVLVRGTIGYARLDPASVTTAALEVKLGLTSTPRETSVLMLGFGSAWSSTKRLLFRLVHVDTGGGRVDSQTVAELRTRDRSYFFAATYAWSANLRDSFQVLVTLEGELDRARGNTSYAGYSAVGLAWSHGPLRLLGEAVLASAARRLVGGSAWVALMPGLQADIGYRFDVENRLHTFAAGIAVRRH